MRSQLITALCVVLLGGCESCASTDEPQSAPHAGTARGTTSSAVIEGTVKLADAAELPGWPVNPMVAGPNRPDLPEACTPVQERDRFPVERVSGGRLSGVLVTLGDFETEPPHEPVTHEVVIRDCRLSPSIVVATRGDRLRLVNETDYPFVPNLGEGLSRALLHTQARILELPQGGMRTLECGFAASCGRTEIVTLYHPLHAVTDESGHFRIEGVPANDELRVSAWHPLFQEAGETITLRPGETRRLDITLEPAPAPEPPPAPPPQERPEDNPDVLF